MEIAMYSTLSKPKKGSHRPQVTDFSPHEVLALANALAARAQARRRRPAPFRGGGLSRIGPLVSAALAEAYAPSHGAPEPTPRASEQGEG